MHPNQSKLHKKKAPKKGREKETKGRTKVQASKQPKRGMPQTDKGTTKYRNLHPSHEVCMYVFIWNMSDHMKLRRWWSIWAVANQLVAFMPTSKDCECIYKGSFSLLCTPPPQEKARKLWVYKLPTLEIF
jgi:hypothetical protein